jgi:hypothetical protein
MRVGDAVDIEVDMQSAELVDADLRVMLDRNVVADGTVHLDPGENHLTLTQHVDTPGFLQVRAELKVNDVTSTLSAMTVGKPTGHVLVLEDQPGQADALATAAPGIVDCARRRYEPAAQCQRSPLRPSLRQHARDEPHARSAAHAANVRPGPGAGWSVGGPRAFAPGGIRARRSTTFPGAAEPPAEPQQGSLALILGIDRSGSMDVISGGATRAHRNLHGARSRAAGRRAAPADDVLGVIAFDSNFSWAVPPTRLY